MIADSLVGDQGGRALVPKPIRELKLRTNLLDLRSLFLQLRGESSNRFLHFLHFATFLQGFVEQHRIVKKGTSQAQERPHLLSQCLFWDHSCAVATATLIDVRLQSASVRADGF